MTECFGQSLAESEQIWLKHGNASSGFDPVSAALGRKIEFDRIPAEALQCLSQIWSDSAKHRPTHLVTISPTSTRVGQRPHSEPRAPNSGHPRSGLRGLPGESPIDLVRARRGLRRPRLPPALHPPPAGGRCPAPAARMLPDACQPPLATSRSPPSASIQISEKHRDKDKDSP